MNDPLRRRLANALRDYLASWIYRIGARVEAPGCTCGDDCDTEPDDLHGDTYRVSERALWSLLEDAAINARNGDNPGDAATRVMTELVMRSVASDVDEEEVTGHR